MPFETLTGLNKAAALLMCLGEEATSKIFQELSDDEIRKLTECMAEIRHIPAEIKEQIFTEFESDEQDLAGIFVRGPDFVKKAIAASGDKDRVDHLMEQFIAGTETRPLETISMMQPLMVAGLLENEHPQTVALVLSTQNPDHSSAILAQLPEAMRGDVIYRIAKIETVSPEVINRIEDALRREIGFVAGKSQEQVGGLEMVVDILGRIEGGLDSDIITSLEESNPEMAEEIKKMMFTFEDLSVLDGQSLQMILREVKNDTLTMAMKTASDEIKEQIFSNMSARAADMIRDDLDAMGPVRLSEVEAMQQSIVKIAMTLEEEGKLVLSTGGGDELV